MLFYVIQFGLVHRGRSVNAVRGSNPMLFARIPLYQPAHLVLVFVSHRDVKALRQEFKLAISNGLVTIQAAVSSLNWPRKSSSAKIEVKFKTI